MNSALEEHRRFLNAYYKKVRYVYDISRKYFLFGRDRTLNQLLSKEWSSLLEIGSGTGRNLQYLAKNRPTVKLAGMDASDEMLNYARQKNPVAQYHHGYAENANFAELLHGKPDIILFSYSLSMIPAPRQAVENALSALEIGGEVWIVDFADAANIWWPMRRLLQRFLLPFRVKPIDASLYKGFEVSLTYGFGRYYQIATIIKQ